MRLVWLFAWSCLFLEKDIEWKVIYVGSAEDETRDQELDAVLLPANNPGRFKFVLQVDAPNDSEIPASDLVGVTIILLACSYKDAEFVRVGYYVSNEYPTPEMNENPPAVPLLDKIKRTIAANDPRVTKFPHKFDFCQPIPAGTANDPELSTDGTNLIAGNNAAAAPAAATAVTTTAGLA